MPSPTWASLARKAAPRTCSSPLAASAPKHKGLPFFQSHGSVDPILGFAEALALEGELKTAGWVGTLSRFEGGHAIPPEIIAGLGAWLETL